MHEHPFDPCPRTGFAGLFRRVLHNARQLEQTFTRRNSIPEVADVSLELIVKVTFSEVVPVVVIQSIALYFQTTYFHLIVPLTEIVVPVLQHPKLDTTLFAHYPTSRFFKSSSRIPKTLRPVSIDLSPS